VLSAVTSGSSTLGQADVSAIQNVLANFESFLSGGSMVPSAGALVMVAGILDKVRLVVLCYT
jgi:hypothetical protein